MNITNPTNNATETALNQELLTKLYSHAAFSAGIYFIILAFEYFIFHIHSYLALHFFFSSISFFLIQRLVTYSKKSYLMAKLFFFILIFGTIIIDFIHNGGIYSPTLYLYFPLTIIILFLTRKKYTIFLSILLIITLTCLFTIHYLWPNFITPFPSQSLAVLERTVSLILSLILTAYLITKILHQYIMDKKRAFKSEEAKSEFLAIMSHMIRTPLNSINGFADFLLDDEITSTEKKYFVNRMQKNAEDLKTLINDLVDLSIIQEKKLRIDPSQFPIHKLLEELKGKAELKNVKHNLHLEFNLDNKIYDTILHTDYKRLLQLLWKIVENGIKYTRKGHVIVSIMPSLNNHISIIVEDSGIGMKNDQKEYLFDLINKQSSGFINEDTSPGLGLNIAHGILDCLGGQLKISSEYETGTKVHISLPVNYKS